MTTRKTTTRGKANTASCITAASAQSVVGTSKQGARTSRRRKNVSTTATGATKDNETDDGTQIEAVPPKHKRDVSFFFARMSFWKTILWFFQKHKKEQSIDYGEQYDKELSVFASETVKTGVAKLVKDFNEARAAAPKNMPKTAFEKNPDKNRYKGWSIFSFQFISMFGHPQ